MPIDGNPSRVPLCSAENIRLPDLPIMEETSIIGRLVRRIYNKTQSNNLELQAVLVEGREIAHEAQAVSRQNHLAEEVPQLPLSLRGKWGIVMGSAAMLAGAGWGGRYLFSSHSESSFTGENRTAASEVYINNNESLQHAGVSEKLVGPFGSREPSTGERINIHTRRHIIYEQVTQKSQATESIVENEDIELYENGMVCSEPLSVNEERAKSKQSSYYHSKRELPSNSIEQFHLQCQQAYNDAEKEDKDKTFVSMNLNTRRGWCSCPPRNMLNAIINKSSTRKPSTTVEEYKTPAFSTLKNVNKRMPLKFIYVEPETYLEHGGVPVQATPAQVQDDVKIVKMDFSCADSRHELSWSKILRQIGTTLSNPISTMMKEVQVFHHYIYLREGCPSPENVKMLTTITNEIDALQTQIITALPGSNMYIMLQLLIGPILKMVADEIDKKKIDANELQELNQQSTIMLRQLIPTLSQDELSSLYQKHSQHSQGNIHLNANLLKNRFKLRDDGIYVDVKGNDYLLHTESDIFSFVVNDDAASRIYFDNQVGKWKFQDEDYYNEGFQRRMRETYGMSINSLPSDKNIHIEVSEGNKKMLSVDLGRNKSEMVFIDGYFIPAKEIAAGRGIKESVTVTRSLKDTPVRVLLWTDKGWMFEPETVKMDDRLEAFLADMDVGIPYDSQNVFSKINDDALSYNRSGKPFIKHGGKYYPVIKTSEGHYSFEQWPSTTVEKINSFYKLKKSPYMISFDNGIKVGFENMEAGQTFLIERDAYEYLINHAQRIDGKPNIKIGKGVYVDVHRRMFFRAGDYTFAVQEYSNNILSIKRNNGENGTKTISLFFNSNMFFRVRDENGHIPTKHLRIKSCRPVRMVISELSVCKPVFINQNVVQKLSEYISADAVIEKIVNQENIKAVNIESFPNVYVDTRTDKYYFFYEGHYFDAEWVSKENIDNVTDKPMLSIITKSKVLRRRKSVAHIVCDVNKSNYEIMMADDYVSRMLNIKLSAARLFIRQVKYKNIASFETLEGAVKMVNLSGYYHFPKPRSSFTAMIPESSLKSIVGKYLYPLELFNDPGMSIEILNINKANENHPLYLKDGIAKIKKTANYIANSMIPVVLIGLNDLSLDFQDYIRKTFSCDDVNFIVSFSQALHARLCRVVKNLDPDKIYLTAITSKIKIKPNDDYYHPVYLTAEQRSEGHVATTLTDESKRIFINYDKLYYTEPNHPDITMREKPATDLISTLIHEASHVEGMTTDLCYFPREEGELVSAGEAIDDMAGKLRQDKFLKQVDFKRINQEYFNNIPLYRNVKHVLTENEQLSYVLDNDPAYLAHLMLNNGDGIALLVKDLYEVGGTLISW